MVSRDARKDLLLGAGLALSSELSLPAVLQRIVDLARHITGARYGALGVLGPDGRIREFIALGMDDATREAIGHYPTGGGILGALIDEAKPMRLADISRDPRSVGFPPNHPSMTSFLGAPVKALGRVFGNIYLTEKLTGEGDASEFTEEDEEDLVVLATQAGIAVANAHLYEETRRRERWLDAVGEINAAILAGTSADELLDLAASKVRELVEADLATIAVATPGGEALANRAAAGEHSKDLLGRHFPVEGSVSGDVIREGRPHVLKDAGTDERTAQPIVAMGGVGAAIVVPMTAHGISFGTLTVANRSGGHEFVDEDVRVVSTFADQASVALEYGRAQAELHRLVVMEDRERIAKELHDGVIQSLFAVGMGLQGTALMTGDEQIAVRVESAVSELDRVIRDLRNYIFGLRPGILADRQLGQALRDLAEDFAAKNGVTTVVDVDDRAAGELWSKAADIVQLTREALSNVGRHAGAATCSVRLRYDVGAHESDGNRGGDGHGGESAVLEIDDDGHGFDVAAAKGSGNGLINLEQRAEALGGALRIESRPGEGSTIRVEIPL